MREETLSAEDGRYVVSRQDALIKHFVTENVNYVASLINKVTLLVDWSLESVHSLPARVFAHHWVLGVEVTSDLLWVEFGEREKLRELSVQELTFGPNLSILLVYDIAGSVSQVTFLVHPLTQLVSLAFLGVLKYDLSVLILIKRAHHVSDVESLALVAEQLRDISIAGHLVSV